MRLIWPFLPDPGIVSLQIMSKVGSVGQSAIHDGFGPASSKHAVCWSLGTAAEPGLHERETR